jgi:hypothetical protein
MIFLCHNALNSRKKDILKRKVMSENFLFSVYYIIIEYHINPVNATLLASFFFDRVEETYTLRKNKGIYIIKV